MNIGGKAGHKYIVKCLLSYGDEIELHFSFFLKDSLQAFELHNLWLITLSVQLSEKVAEFISSVYSVT